MFYPLFVACRGPCRSLGPQPSRRRRHIQQCRSFDQIPIPIIYRIIILLTQPSPLPAVHPCHSRRSSYTNSYSRAVKHHKAPSKAQPHDRFLLLLPAGIELATPKLVETAASALAALCGPRSVCVHQTMCDEKDISLFVASLP